MNNNNNEATTQQCEDCAKPARHLCPRCADGVDLHGQARKVYYCGKDCQSAHWAAGHKLECKVAIDRRSLFRTGSLVQLAFYYSSKAVWYEGVSKVQKIEQTERDGEPRLLVWRGERQDGVDFPAFRDNLVEEERNRQAMLAGSVSAVPITAPFVDNLVKGMCPRSEFQAIADAFSAANCHIKIEEVGVRPTASRYVKFIPQDETAQNMASTCYIFRATLRNGQMFALDPCNAQYNFTTAAERGHGIFEWDSYMDRLLVANRAAIDVQPLYFRAPPAPLSGNFRDAQAGIFVDTDIKAAAETRAYSNLVTFLACLRGVLAPRPLPLPEESYLTLTQLMSFSSIDYENKRCVAALTEVLDDVIETCKEQGTKKDLLDRLRREKGN